LLFSCLLCSVGLTAQIAAPDLQCTRSEAGAVMLNWANAAASCGSFEAIEIWTADAADGPFRLLDELTDGNATSYSDPNPAGSLRYYYLRYRYDCPGVLAMNSDTLDNLIPVTPVIRYVGVEDDELVIAWNTSVSPEVIGYIILEVFPTVFVPLDTVFTGTEFRLPFTAADTPPQERRFRLVAIDGCGNDSPQGPVVNAPDLTATGGSGCTSDIELIIDQASFGRFPPATALELFASVNGGPFVSAGTTGPAATTISFREANDGETVCFYVEAVLTNDQGRARSAVYCQTVSINQPIRDFPLYGVDIDETTGGPRFQYEAAPGQPEPIDAELLLTRTGNLLASATLDGPIFGGGGGLLFGDPLAEPTVPGETFRFRLTDDCMREVTTNAVEPVYLTASSFAPGRNDLRWTPLINGLDGETTYSVIRIEDGSTPTSVATGLTELTFTDNFISPAGGEVCYRIIAFFQPEGATGTPFVFNSNRDCITPPREVFVPNAFSPNGDGTNDEFRPFFSSPPAAEGYFLEIWDRWGSLIFETADPDFFWDGTDKMQPVPPGTYLYTLRFLVEEGRERRLAGTVNLLR